MTVMRVPFIDLSRYENGFVESLFPKVRELIEKTQFVGGPQIASLESALSKEVGVAHTVNCANGTDALQLALRGVGVGAGDSVLVANFNFWASFEAVVNVGATPITVDVGEQFHLEVETVAQAIEKHRPKALCLVNLFGWACPDLLKIRSLCQKEKVQLVEDNAQAVGTFIDGKSIFQGALVSTTSFYPAKVLGASGDAGAVFCDDEALMKKMRSLGNHGRAMHYSYGSVGWNSRMGAYEATFLLESLPHLKARIESRKKVCAFYREALKGSDKIEILNPPKGVDENGYLSVGRVKGISRDLFKKKLEDHGIGVGIVYPETMSSQEGAKPYLKAHFGGDKAEVLCRSAFNLPCFAYMKEDESAFVVETVKKVLKEF